MTFVVVDQFVDVVFHFDKLLIEILSFLSVDVVFWSFNFERCYLLVFMKRKIILYEKV